MSLALGTFFATRTPGYADTRALGDCLQALVDKGLDQLPSPASGQILERWRTLALVAGHDLGLCKLYEGHTDALAIFQELGVAAPEPGTCWGMWAAEPPQARVHVQCQGDALLVNGRKAWCSGAAVLSHALMTAWDTNDQQQLVAVDLRQPGVSITQDGWHAVGMGATGSVEVAFDRVKGIAVGKPGDYLSRPGFWQGGIGIAACWYGASLAIAAHLLKHCGKSAEPHAMAHLGAVDVALHSALCVLQDAAHRIDQAPADNAQWLACRSRAAIEHSAEQVISHVGRALGAGPYCKDPHFARLIADLPVFLRQSHAERDLAALGAMTAEQAFNPARSNALLSNPPTGMWQL